VVPKNCCDDDAVEDVVEDDDDGKILNQCKCDFVSNKNLSFHLSPPPPPPPGRTPPPPLPGLGFNGESMSGIKLVTLLETTEQCKTPNLCNKIVGLVLFSLLVDLVLFRRLLAVWSNKEIVVVVVVVGGMSGLLDALSKEPLERGARAVNWLALAGRKVVDRR
jgi:hypothetical protein